MQKSIKNNINTIKVIKLALNYEWQEKLKKRAQASKRSIEKEIYHILWQTLFYEARRENDFMVFIDKFIKNKRLTKKIKY